MKPYRRPRIARRFAACRIYRDIPRKLVAHLDTDAGTITLGLLGCSSTRKTFDVSDLYDLQVKSGKVTLFSKTILEVRGKRRQVVAEIEIATGKIAVGVKGLKARKTYTLADLFTWGEQLQLI